MGLGNADMCGCTTTTTTHHPLMHTPLPPPQTPTHKLTLALVHTLAQAKGGRIHTRWGCREVQYERDAAWAPTRVTGLRLTKGAQEQVWRGGHGGWGGREGA